MTTLLLATDFSTTGNNAVDYGCELALRLKARVVLVHAFSLPLGGYDSMAPLELIAEMQTSSHDALRVLKRELAAKFGEGLEILSFTEAGSSEGIITEAAQKYDANIVVVGIDSGAGVVKKHLTGSTVTDVIHSLTIPVLIVPNACKFNELNSFLFAFDPEEDTDKTFAILAGQFAKSFAAKLDVISVLGLPIDTHQADFVKTRIRDLFDGNLNNLHITHAEDVKLGLEQALQNTSADLVMIHPHKHGFLHRLFESGTTTRLVYALKTPMLSFHL